MNSLPQGFQFAISWAAIVLIIGQIIALIGAIIAAIRAKRFKMLVFVVTYFEWFGSALFLTIIGIPIGLGMILASQSALVLIQIEKNTSQALQSGS